VIQEDRSLLVPDVSADPRWHADLDSISGFQTRSILCVPLRVKGQVVGALEALNKRDGPFTEYDLRLLSSLADLAAQSIENARLYDQIQRDARRLEEAFNEVRKLDELKSAFIRSVTHELRTPMTLIVGYVELLLDGQMGSLQPEQYESLSLVAEKSAQLAQMVNDIISLQTVGAMGFDFEVMSLLPLALDVVDEARPKAEKARIRFELDLPSAGDLPSIRGDARRLRRAFEHLLDNAIKFSPNGGKVTVSIEHEGEMLFVRVRDEGVGLPQDQLERIFDRFYQVDGSATRRFGGTGLGLAQVKEVVEAHGGAVWVESDGPGQGSTFTVYLPIFQE
jgi:signal transduction histidine kinase